MFCPTLCSDDGALVVYTKPVPPPIPRFFLYQIMAALDTSASQWMAANLTADDVKLLSPLFSSQGVTSLSDFQTLKRDDFVELKFPIGTRS